MPCYSSVPSQRAPVPADTSPGFPGFPVGLSSMATSRMGSSLLGAQAVLPHCRRLNLRALPGSMGRATAGHQGCWLPRVWLVVMRVSDGFVLGRWLRHGLWFCFHFWEREDSAQLSLALFLLSCCQVEVVGRWCLESSGNTMKEGV